MLLLFRDDLHIYTSTRRRSMTFQRRITTYALAGGKLPQEVQFKDILAMTVTYLLYLEGLVASVAALTSKLLLLFLIDLLICAAPTRFPSPLRSYIFPLSFLLSYILFSIVRPSCDKASLIQQCQFTQTITRIMSKQGKSYSNDVLIYAQPSERESSDNQLKSISTCMARLF